MPRINLILESPLFTDFSMRNGLKIFIETKLNIFQNPEVLIKKLPIDFVFSMGAIKPEIINAIIEARPFINFEHDASDERLQILFFLFLIYSLNQFPDKASWISFLNETDEIKTEHIIEGVSRVWLDFQKQLIHYDLLIEPDNLPF